MTLTTLFIIGCSLLHNAVVIVEMPRGLTGYEVVARSLTTLERPGNVLTSCYAESDLIFRYRCRRTEHERQFIRGDRVLAVRVADYAGVAPETLVESKSDVIDVLRQGRIRYLLTCPGSGNARRPADMIIAHETATSAPDQFTLLRKCIITFAFGNLREEEVCVWRYEGQLPPGKSELPVIIPTASIVLQPE